MKYTVKWSGRFKKSYKLAKKRGLDINLLKGVISSLSNGIPLEKSTKITLLVESIKVIASAISNQIGC